MSGKVRLPRTIAELMVNIKRDILLDIPYMQRMATGEYPDTEVLSPIYDWYLDNKDKYFSALAIGYEVEETPEEKVKRYFEKHAETRGNGKYVVADVLHLLGIKIEGVNA